MVHRAMPDRELLLPWTCEDTRVKAKQRMHVRDRRPVRPSCRSGRGASGHGVRAWRAHMRMSHRLRYWRRCSFGSFDVAVIG